MSHFLKRVDSVDKMWSTKAMLAQSELEHFMKDLESDRVEKTIAITDADKIGEAICSFANDLSNHQKPGYLLLGVRDDGELNGLKVTDQLMQTMLDFRSDGRIVPPPALSVAKFNFSGGDVAVVEILPSYQPPVRFKGKICIRVGPRKGKANEAEERVLFEKRSSFARSFDTWPCQGSKIADISLDLFKLNYLPKAIDEETLRINHRDLQEQLASLKFFDYRAACPTFAGILLFNSNPKFFLPGAYVQYVKFNGRDEACDIVREKEFNGDLISLLQSIDRYIGDVIVAEKSIPETALRERKIYNYPFFAIREVLMNAIMHRDYQSNAPIRLYEFTNRIEISNPGGLFGNARPENFPSENDYRNPTLAEAMKNLGYVNRFRRGIIRTKEALNNNQNPEPIFIFDKPTSFSVTLFAREI